MKQKILAILCMISLILCAIGCGSKEEKTTTVTGMVVSVDGTVISLMKTDGKMQGNFSGQRPENGKMPEGFDPENMPEGFDPENIPKGFGGNFNPENMPEGFGGNFDPENMPEGMERPQRPADGSAQRPENGETPERPTGETPDFKGFGGKENVETESMDLKNAHISVEIEDGKATGSMDDIKQGSIVTLTLNEKGEVTNVLVSSSGFQGFGQGFGNRGQGRPNTQNGQSNQAGQKNETAN